MNSHSTTPEDKKCIHCGTTFHPRRESDDFCCKGCEFVYGLIRGQGLDQFYQLRRGTSDPVKGIPFQPRQYAWLEELVKEAETTSPEQPVLVLELQGISCIGCVWLIDKLFDRQAGARKIEVNAQRGQMRLSWQPGAFDALAFARELQQFGYLVGPPGTQERSTSSKLTSRLGLCGAFALNAMMFTLPRYLGMEETFPLASTLELLSVLFSTLCLVVGGSYFITRAVAALRQRVLHIDLPIALGIIIAYIGSLAGWLTQTAHLLYFDFVAIFIFLMLLGRWTQEYALEKNRNRLLSAERKPVNVRVVEGDGEPAPISLDKLKAGQRIRIQPGELVPVCARLGDAGATFSLEWINGEAEPRSLRPGELVPSGALYTGVSEISIQAEETWSESLLRRLLDITQPQERNTALERILRSYLGTVLVVAFAGAIGWWLTSGNILATLQVFISVLVVSCPCALGVAYPLANELAISRLRQSGVFVREPSLWTRLSRVKSILFDKTGTLTLESPQLSNPEAIDTLLPEAREALSHLVERSLHPVSRALRESLSVVGGTHQVNDVVEHVGFGLVWHDGDKRWSLGRPGWDGTENTGMDFSIQQDRPFDSELRCNGEPTAHFSFSEAVRPDASEEIQALSASGYRHQILSGDRQEKVDILTRELGLPRECGLGNMTPTDKANWIDANTPNSAMMLGDGANDSLAFDRALCRGTPVVDKGLLEQKADFYLIGQSLKGLSALFSLASNRHLAMRDILAFAIAYNVLAVAVCLAGMMHPLLAAIIMPLSSLATLGIVTLRLGRG